MKNKGGRPVGSKTKTVKPFDVPQLEQMAAVGLTTQQMSALLGMSTASFERRLKDDLAVRDAVHKGRARAIFNVGATAYQQAVSGKVPAMTMFFLKCRAGWKETQAVEHTGKDGESLFTSFTDMVKRIGGDGPDDGERV